MKFKKLEVGEVFFCKDDPDCSQPFMKVASVCGGERNAVDLNTGRLWIVDKNDRVKRINFDYEIWEDAK